MSKEADCCDDCGDSIPDVEVNVWTKLPFSVASANETESAALCDPCNTRMKDKVIAAIQCDGVTRTMNQLDLIMEDVQGGASIVAAVKQVDG